MFSTSSAHILIRRSKVIILASFIFALVAMLVTIIFPLDYRADAQILIISRSRYGVDPYTVAKSAERIGENIVQVVKTNDFYNKVISQTQYSLDLSRFQNVSERTKRNRWQESVDASVVFGTGVLNISAYHEKADEAKKLASAVAEVLVSQGADYVGGDMTMRVVNEPIATRVPVRPNVLFNAVLGFVIGVLMMGLVVARRG